MRWLWLISVGVSDVQLPVWRQDDYGCWVGPQHFQLKRGGVRQTHLGLLNLLRQGRIRFENQLPAMAPREISDRLHLEFEQDPVSGEFLAQLRPADYRLSEHDDMLPNDHEDSLALYCPKVAPLVPQARALFGTAAVTVLVLSTRRAEDFSEASGEPLASGPLIAHYLAQQFDLHWQDEDGAVPDALPGRLATWLDLLIEQEASEDPAAQQHCVARLNAALRAWLTGSSGEQGVLITTSGGMPPLKPLIERVPAIWLGQDRVQMLDRPERGGKSLLDLDYGARVTERETLRFHAAETLRAGDYAGAYGLARRAVGQPWSEVVRHQLGPLLELPGPGLRLKDTQVEPFMLHAAQVEIRLCMNDVAGALLRLGPFIESVAWKLIAEDARIQALGLKVDRANESLLGTIPRDDALLSGKVQYFRPNTDGSNGHRVNALTWEWPKWLAQPEGGQRETALALIQVCVAYNSDQRSMSPRQCRNLLAHGSDQAVVLSSISAELKNRGLILSVGRRFGDNALASARIATLLNALGAGDLATTLRDDLADLLRILPGKNLPSSWPDEDVPFRQGGVAL